MKRTRTEKRNIIILLKGTFRERDIISRKIGKQQNSSSSYDRAENMMEERSAEWGKRKKPRDTYSL